MKLLFDQNLSPSLVTYLNDLFPESQHVQDLNLAEASDVHLWEYARESGYCIVTKDSDFNDIGLVRGFPPSIVWVRRGNCSTPIIETILRENQALIQKLESSEKKDGIVVLF